MIYFGARAGIGTPEYFGLSYELFTIAFLLSLLDNHPPATLSYFHSHILFFAVPLLIVSAFLSPSSITTEPKEPSLTAFLRITFAFRLDTNGDRHLYTPAIFCGFRASTPNLTSRFMTTRSSPLCPCLLWVQQHSGLHSTAVHTAHTWDRLQVTERGAPHMRGSGGIGRGASNLAGFCGAALMGWDRRHGHARCGTRNQTEHGKQETITRIISSHAHSLIRPSEEPDRIITVAICSARQTNPRSISP